MPESAKLNSGFLSQSFSGLESDKRMRNYREAQYTSYMEPPDTSGWGMQSPPSTTLHLEVEQDALLGCEFSFMPLSHADFQVAQCHSQQFIGWEC